MDGSVLMQALLFEKYGPRLGIKQLAEAVSLSENTIYNQIAAGTFGVRTYMDGGKRFADTRDVAAYLDTKRAEGKAAAQKEAA